MGASPRRERAIAQPMSAAATTVRSSPATVTDRENSAVWDAVQSGSVIAPVNDAARTVR